jgi:hypothetical protein
MIVCIDLRATGSLDACGQASTAARDGIDRDGLFNPGDASR